MVRIFDCVLISICPPARLWKQFVEFAVDVGYVSSGERFEQDLKAGVVPADLPTWVAVWIMDKCMGELPSWFAVFAH